jgi:hypothetical protein
VNTETLKLPSARFFAEPDLAFHPERLADRSPHPLLGLSQFGPYSRSLVNKVLDPIRVAAILPHGWTNRFENLLKELEVRHRPQERRNYLPEFDGFSRIFGLRAISASNDAVIELDATVDRRLAASQRPHRVLAEVLTGALSAVAARRTEFDVLFVFLPSSWEPAFGSAIDDDFDLHDYVKAITAVRGIPMQIVLEDSALSYFCRCSVMWRLSIALYVKAGGVPWKVADADPETAIVGLSYAVRRGAAAPTYVTCCSQVFDADGAGLEFILYETDQAIIQRRNPFLSRAEMRRIMARSLDLYQRRHAGRSPKRVIVHKSTEFKPDEVEGCFDAWRSPEGLDLVQVQQSPLWRAVKLDRPRDSRSSKGVPANYPVDRGASIQLGGRDVLVWTQGNAHLTASGANYYKEGKGIPAPLLLTRFAGHGTFDYECISLLGLTKMNWNNDGLYDRLPVTLSYAQVLARTIKRMPQISSTPYQLRFFM